MPLMNLALRLTGPLRSGEADRQLIAITAFQGYQGGVPRYGALTLSSPPIPIRVNDVDGCELQGPWLCWPHLAIACFEHPGCGAVPVLNLGTMFSTPAGGIDERTAKDTPYSTWLEARNDCDRSLI